jgi:hypothetical protein
MEIMCLGDDFRQFEGRVDVEGVTRFRIDQQRAA